MVGVGVSMTVEMRRSIGMVAVWRVVGVVLVRRARRIQVDVQVVNDVVLVR